MAIKNILLHLGIDKRCAARTDYALALAEVHEAHVTGLYTMPAPMMPAHVLEYIPPQYIERQKAVTREKAKEAKKKFLAACDRAGIRSEWRDTEEDPLDALALQSRYADVIVVGQPDEDEGMPIGYESLPQDLVLAAGRPVLTVPFAGKFTKSPSRVMVAWNGSREAARAVSDAEPILRKAKKVIVLVINPPKENRIAGADIATHLARHNIKVEVKQVRAPDMKVADTIVSAVTDYDIDMMVMGAYGHSRLREVILGGATENVLEEMTVPVLMSN